MAAHCAGTCRRRRPRTCATTGASASRWSAARLRAARAAQVCAPPSCKGVRVRKKGRHSRGTHGYAAARCTALQQTPRCRSTVPCVATWCTCGATRRAALQRAAVRCHAAYCVATSRTVVQCGGAALQHAALHRVGCR
jgi:hypothetical protein